MEGLRTDQSISSSICNSSNFIFSTRRGLVTTLFTPGKQASLTWIFSCMVSGLVLLVCFVGCLGLCPSAYVPSVCGFGNKTMAALQKKKKEKKKTLVG